MLFCFISLMLISQLADTAPGRSKSSKPLSQTVYDQKQKGDYNVQVHLKDFQIIALVSDTDLSGLGDYDYNYDYADFTVKPPGSSSTQKPTVKPSSLPTLAPSSQKPQLAQVSETSEKPLSTQNPVIELSSTTEPIASKSPSVNELGVTETIKNKTTNISEIATPTTIVFINEALEVKPSSTIQKIPDEIPLAPGKIKVQIIEVPAQQHNSAVVPGEDSGMAHPQNHVKRCLSGFTRDKKGRCRRTVRPQLPFGVGRLVSNLASRLRYNPSKTSLLSSDSVDD